ncbi:MAG: UDP-N-acetylglucosamine--N-acetylmuramyl-(pentapeptide) pyrophosphoryl-undecaprenol N-acetylglucosamine transferase [Victivallales bacterium]|nr:UDP-N-acetylglucosamine--N-acetylmuramyl-(pentapeptide) pyrophosphoryl-undecaprenol N-acetylglucosamine transferase [Victivallales bacterium]
MSNLGHLIVACGGTGGHFYPALSVARAYCERGGKATLLVSGKHAAEQRVTAGRFGLPTRQIRTVRAPQGLREALAFPFRMCSCVRETRRVLSELEGDILLGMGSFAAVPPCWAWPWREKPMVLHEGNAFMGKVNRLFAKHAAALALSLPLAVDAQRKGVHAEITGMPLRAEILDAAAAPVDERTHKEILESYGLAPDRKTMLVFGGSQGAQAINALMCGVAARLKDLSAKLQFILLTGVEQNDSLEEAFIEAGLAARIVKADSEIQRCYQVCDLVLCRAGASSICELALFRKPMILVPLPGAADNHQFVNARTLEQAGAARCLEQRLATPEALDGILRDWLANPAPWQAMGEAAGQFAHPDATKAVVDLLVAQSASH